MNDISNDQFGIPEKETFNALKQKLHPGLLGKFKSNISAGKARKTKALSIHNADIPNLDWLRYFPNLESLLLTSPVLNDLGGLQYAPKLTVINFTGKWPKGLDLRPLANCTKLTELDITYCGRFMRDMYAAPLVEVHGLEALQKLRDVRYLGLGGLGINDIGWIEGMQNVEDLDLSYNPISDLRPLTALKRVEEIDLTACGLSDIKYLGQITSLKNLNLEVNKISDFSFLTELNNLETLYAEDNGLDEQQREHWLKTFEHLKDCDF